MPLVGTWLLKAFLQDLPRSGRRPEMLLCLTGVRERQRRGPPCPAAPHRCWQAPLCNHCSRFSGRELAQTHTCSASSQRASELSQRSAPGTDYLPAPLVQSAMHGTACLGQQIFPQNERPSNGAEVSTAKGIHWQCWLYWPAISSHPFPMLESKNPVEDAFGGGGQAEVEGRLLAYPNPKHCAKFGIIHGHTSPLWDPKGLGQAGCRTDPAFDTPHPQTLQDQLGLGEHPRQPGKNRQTFDLPPPYPSRGGNPCTK